jgi:hypothetical protein
MFPQTYTTEDETQTVNNVISDGEIIYKTPDYDFATLKTILKNGDVSLVDDYKNVRNWIVKFLNTPIDKKEIYEGTGFGTSLYKLKGYKSISALQFAQIKKEIEDGFLLNPNIKSVEDVRLWKEGRTMMLYVKVKLADGYILEEKTEVINVNRN